MTPAMIDPTATPAEQKTGVYKVCARRIGPGLSEAVAKHSRFEFDTGVEPSETIAGPAELLLSAFAACLLKNVERVSRLLPFAYQDVAVQVQAERQEHPPRFTQIRYVLRLTTNEPPHRVELLHRNLAKFGTVYNTLATGADVQGEIETRPWPASTLSKSESPMK